MQEHDTGGVRPSQRWGTRAQLAAYLGVHPGTIIRWEKAGILPEPVRMGPGTVRHDFHDPRVLNPGVSQAPAAAE